MENKQPTEIIEKLDIIIKLLSLNIQAESDKSKIYKLSMTGMTPSQISKIMGKPLNTITARISDFKKGKLNGKQKTKIKPVNNT